MTSYENLPIAIANGGRHAADSKCSTLPRPFSKRYGLLAPTDILLLGGVLSLIVTASPQVGSWKANTCLANYSLGMAIVFNDDAVSHLLHLARAFCNADRSSYFALAVT